MLLAMNIKNLSISALTLSLFASLGMNLAQLPAWADTTDAAHASSNTKPIIIQPEQNTLKIQLQGNPTTGYHWFLKQYPSRYLKLKNYQFIPGVSTMPGAPGTAEFTFKICPTLHKAPIMTSVTFAYLRPWDNSTEVDNTLTILSIADTHASQTQTQTQDKTKTSDTQKNSTTADHSVESQIDQADQTNQISPKTNSVDLTSTPISGNANTGKPTTTTPTGSPDPAALGTPPASYTNPKADNTQAETQQPAQQQGNQNKTLKNNNTWLSLPSSDTQN